MFKIQEIPIDNSMIDTSLTSHILFENFLNNGFKNIIRPTFNFDPNTYSSSNNSTTGYGYSPMVLDNILSDGNIIFTGGYYGMSIRILNNDGTLTTKIQ